MNGSMLGTLGVLLLAGLLAWAGIRWFEQTNLYFPDRRLVADPGQVGMPFEEVWLTTEDDVKLHGWLIKAEKPAAGTVIFLHGNAVNISYRLDKAKRLQALGANILLFDYRGYGQSGGRPSEKGLYRDA